MSLNYTKFVPGDRVTVLRGHLEGKEGEVREVRGSHVFVRLDIEPRFLVHFWDFDVTRMPAFAALYGSKR